MWTKRERVLAVLNGERPDRVPIFECVAHDGILEHFGGAQIKTGTLEAVFPPVVRACSQFLDLSHPAFLPQVAIQYERNGALHIVAERWSTWTLPQPVRTERDMAKDLLARIEEAEAWRSPETAAADFRRKVEEANRHAGEMVLIHIGTECPILPYDIEQGIYAFTDIPDLTRRWNHCMNQKALRRLDAMAEASFGPVAICWNDVAFKGRLIYPPEILEELLYPHLAAQVDLLHSRGIKVLFHSDGDVTEALPRLVECGIDGFNPLEISAGMDVRKFQDICGSRVALVGGIDAVEVLARGTPQLVAQKTRQLIDWFRDTGNLMVASASGEIDNSMPTENVLAMYETVWSYGKY